MFYNGCMTQAEQPETLADSFARRTAESSVAERQASAAEEIRRAVEAAYRLIARTGDIDPSIREVLRESGLSTQAFYKHFRSKDELMLVLLDDGRRRLLGYLEHRMDKATSPEGRVRAWVEGVLAQGANEEAAARTRPFVAGQDRLADRFPSEQQRSMDLLVELLARSVERLPGAVPRNSKRDAEAIYHVTFGTLRQHLAMRSVPSGAEVDHLVRFSVQGAGAPGRRTRDDGGS
jgi:AcrR family transcriptional regulator